MNVHSRIILLGASNLANALPLLPCMLAGTVATPTEVLIAAGHGRSYGNWSRLFGARELPPISDCRLWDQLGSVPTCEQQKSRDEDETIIPSGSELSQGCQTKGLSQTDHLDHTFALLTDIGNDLVYGASNEEILCWVHQCLNRLRDHHANVIVTLPPWKSVSQISRWRYYLIKLIFFPGRRLPIDQMKNQLQTLCEGVSELAETFDSHVVIPPAEWYGFDPIHIQRRVRIEAWQRILAEWNFDWDSQLSPERQTACRNASFRPFLRKMWGRVQEHPQPVLELEDFSISCY